MKKNQGFSKNAPASPSDVEKALRRVVEPELKKDLVSLGMVKNIAVREGRASFEVELTTPACPLKDKIRAECEAAVKALPGIRSVAIAFTHRVPSPPAAPNRDFLPGVKNVVAVYAAKGGVGKSTVASNLAASLALDGCAVGLFDADIHGPSVPRMMGVKGNPEGRDGKLVPPVAHGVKIMSWGLVAQEEETPRIWRGPMIHGAVRQLLKDTLWGPLDYLVVDLPPGTGDAQLTLVQNVPLAGIVAVTTPQAVALDDGVKGINMFRKFYVPILGLVENMSGFICPHCGKETDIFSKGGGEKEAARLKIPYLGAVPIDPSVVSGGDRGVPIVLSHPKSPSAKALRWMAQIVAGQISVHNFQAAQAAKKSA